IESRSSRMITILVTPFMSCSARLPVLVLFAGAFFPRHAAFILVGLYLLGIVVAIITARLLRLVKYSKDETPFVMELPPYRWPTMRATLRHMWEKCAQYIKKIGTVILLSTVVIWFLSYYPRPDESRQQAVQDTEQTATNGINEESFIAMIGHAVEPVLAPLGQNWRSSIALITSIPAKELVVSTLGVLYSSDSEESIQEDLRSSGDFTPRSAAAFMVFILLFFPCIATIAAISDETGSRGWAIFSIVYNTAVAWIAGYLVYLIGGVL
ncbi:MAG: ferrous iron transporter B, partial [Bacteroidaceae bacterium]|nr:ferrous iron transporter B [Bacteroidaceae bacterium]